ncbi:2,3-diaminopropionate biosynthesis protein SbnA [Mesonia maritima]|uniref:N-(2-amino-2-carboxyethyl)-L-glutamate synthase n=1 Tax=Mesonia maritima TaxID=1793873 RepID=A0ABU1K7J9_9FLAO|nr:2,3-diaminopropionate biosynthesis protein SbnA [Mesonia maritima]MDR6301584.1 cysteine synthase A [Mesonia maritima]
MKTSIHKYASALEIKSNILDNIGKTPLISLGRLFKDLPFSVFGKLESENPGGSIKDRTALNMLTKALDTGLVKPGDTIIESSSGNMAIGLAQICKFYNLHLITVVDPHINSHTEKLLHVYGAKLIKVTTTKDNESFLESRLRKVEELLEEIPNSYWPNQYENQANPQTHFQTMGEIAEVLNEKVDYLFVATSTCGTLMGCAEYIKAHNLPTKLIAVDAVGSVIFGDEKRERLIPGHGSGRKSNFLKKEFIYDVIHINDENCIRGCWQLLQNESILCGGSSGAVISAIEFYQDKIEKKANCVAILCDRGDRYLDTVYNKKWIAENFSNLDVKSL